MFQVRFVLNSPMFRPLVCAHPTNNETENRPSLHSCCPDSRELAKTQRECKRLEQEVLELRKEAKQSAEQANMVNFQNQLLIDMVREPQQLML